MEGALRGREGGIIRVMVRRKRRITMLKGLGLCYFPLKAKEKRDQKNIKY